MRWSGMELVTIGRNDLRTHGKTSKLNSLLPTVLRNWWGFYYPGGNVIRRTLVVVDYQNIHLTAHGQWCSNGAPVHDCLIHPLHFANQVIQVRNLVRRLAVERNGGEFEELKLAKVRSFRGLPSNKRAPKQYQRSQRQKSEWTRDSRSEVEYRALKYYTENGRTVAREKGVDVMVALDLVVGAAGKDFDTVILATHDTDVEPALALAARIGGAQIETAGWMNCKRLTVSGSTFWHTALDENRFIASQDQSDYS